MFDIYLMIAGWIILAMCAFSIVARRMMRTYITKEWWLVLIVFCAFVVPVCGRAMGWW